MDRKVCFFIGHRDAPESVLKLLDDAIERHIAEYKVTTFIVGHYGNFDRMAARMLVAAKKKHPYISLLMHRAPCTTSTPRSTPSRWSRTLPFLPPTAHLL